MSRGASGGQKVNKSSRVQIWYELQTKNGAIEKKNIPFVMFSMADFRGKPKQPREKLRDRKPVEITGETFDKVMKSMAPRAQFQVPNVLPGANKDEDVPVDITFESLASFSPQEIAKAVPAMKKLLDTRNQLQNLLTYIDADKDIESLAKKLTAPGGEELLKSLMAAAKPADGTPS